MSCDFLGGGQRVNSPKERPVFEKVGTRGKNENEAVPEQGCSWSFPRTSTAQEREFFNENELVPN